MWFVHVVRPSPAQLVVYSKPGLFRSNSLEKMHHLAKKDLCPCEINIENLKSLYELVAGEKKKLFYADCSSIAVGPERYKILSANWRAQNVSFRL